LYRVAPTELDTSMTGLFLEARVLSVYDGDTITVAVVPPWHRPECPFVGKLRLEGIDAPEMKPRLTTPLRELQMKAALKVARIVADKIADTIVWVEFSRNEKFGRMMGTIYLDAKKRTNFNQWLIDQGLVKAYDGQKKTDWTEDDLTKIMQRGMLPL
jgi:endonuclease YncB( thermonuclease family)